MAEVIVVLVFFWALVLLFNGRANSPKRRRQEAHWNYLLEQAIKDKAEGR